MIWQNTGKQPGSNGNYTRTACIFYSLEQLPVEIRTLRVPCVGGVEVARRMRSSAARKCL